MIEAAAPVLHDAIILCAGVAAVYLVVVVLQLMQLKRHSIAAVGGMAAREPSLGLHLPGEVTRTENDADSFAMQLKYINIDAELQRVKLELERLHSELGATRDEVDKLRNQGRIANVAPLYNEAMGFARRGLTAEGIAARCGISRGEAELVVALARNAKNPVSAEGTRSRTQETNQRNDRQLDRYRAAA